MKKKKGKMGFNIIGDIHGRTMWKDLVDDKYVNIFIGDYFDPYEPIPFEDLAANFMDIIMFKQQHPETVLLLGNHDYLTYYTHKEIYSRYNRAHSNDIHELLTSESDFINGFAYLIDNKHIVTHAGITYDWANKWLDKDVVERKDPKEIVNAINALFGQTSPFSFDENSSCFDVYGDSQTQSPLWIRPSSLVQFNLYKDTDVNQIIGHTQVSMIAKHENIILTDCLGTITNSLVIDSDGNEFVQKLDKNNKKILTQIKIL